MTIARRIGYIRTSPGDSPDALHQLAWIEGLVKTFTDHAGPRQGRPQRGAALGALKAGDTLVVHSMNRLARTREELETLLRESAARGIAVEFVSEAVTLDPSSAEQAHRDLALVMAGVRWQLDSYAELQGVGINRAKKIQRRYTGRPMKLTPAKARAMIERYRALPTSGDNATRIAADFDVTRETMYRYIRAGDALLDATTVAKKATGQAYRAAAKAKGPAAAGGAARLLKRAKATERHAISLRRKAFAESKGVTLAEATAKAQPEAKAAAQADADSQKMAKQAARRVARDDERAKSERRGAELLAKYRLSAKGTPQPDAEKVSDKDPEPY